MNRLELGKTNELAELTELLRRVSAMDDPQAVQREFSRRMHDVSGTEGYIGVSRRGMGEGEYKITRMMLSDEDLSANPVDPWKQWEEIPVQRGGWIGQIIADEQPVVFTDLHLRGDPVLGDAIAGFRSAAAAPLFDEGQAMNWGIMLRREPNGYSREDLIDLFMRGNLIGRMTRNLVMRKEVEALNHRLTNQLEEIAQIQMSLLPSRTPDVPGLSIATSYLTSNEAGGDYYDFFDMGEGRFGVFIGDVSGHGAGAATVMAMLQTILHGFQERHLGPAKMLEHANRHVLAKRIEGNFVTALLAVFDPERRTVTYSNAGHHPALLRSADGSVHPLNGAHAIPLGITEEIGFEEKSRTVRPSDSLILYTDGITEAFSPPPDREMFGVERLVSSLVECSGEPPCVVDSIHESLYRHTYSRERADDQTIVAVRVEG